jgi:predicted GNAT family N-acyltransferase
MRLVMGDWEGLRADALAVRRPVFVEEQGVPEELELDGEDPNSTHLVGFEDGEAVACARLRPYGSGVAKVERVAVVKSKRGTGWGARVMDALENRARDEGYLELVLNAQSQVVGFYEKRGYAVEGEEFEEAGIPHRRMRLRL